MFIVNVPRPVPGADLNAMQIRYIEPLRKDSKVIVSNAYMFNLEQYQKGEECSWSPGFKYEFGFVKETDALEFKKLCGVE